MRLNTFNSFCYYPSSICMVLRIGISLSILFVITIFHPNGSRWRKRRAFNSFCYYHPILPPTRPHYLDFQFFLLLPHRDGEMSVITIHPKLSILFVITLDMYSFSILGMLRSYTFNSFCYYHQDILLQI